ncbi:MAG: GAF domain-containing protein [Gemmatimonadota bacterium]
MRNPDVAAPDHRPYGADDAPRWRAEVLQQLTSGLVRLQSVAEIGAFCSRELSGIIGADTCWAGQLTNDGQSIETIALHGVPDAVAGPWQRFSIDAPVPISTALRERRALWFSDKAALLEAFPGYAYTARAIDREATAFVPLAVGGSGGEARAVGALSIGFRLRHVFDETTRAFIMTLAQQCALALDRARLLEAERAARAAADHAASRTARLQAVTAALSKALAAKEIAEVITEQGSAAFDADGAAVYILDDSGMALTMLADRGFSKFTRRTFATVPLDAKVPAADVVRTSESLFVSDFDALVGRYPNLAEAIATTGRQAIAGVPLRDTRGTVGVLIFAFDRPQMFTTADRAFATALATQCVQAFERARLYEAHSASARRAAFLSDASRTLALPLETTELLRLLAELPVPVIADYSIVYRVGADGMGHRVARAHVSAAGAQVLDSLEREYPLAHASEVPAARVLRTHETLFLPLMRLDDVSVVAPDERYMDLVAELEPCSGIVVPLVARGRALGALVLAMASRARGGSARQFTTDDVTLAQSLAERAALALDALMILEDAERAREDAEHANRAKSDFLATMSHELRTPLNAIAGHVQLIDMGLHGPVTEAQHVTLQRVTRAQERLLGLINDILNFARLEAGHVEYRIEPISVSDVTAEMVGLMEPQFVARSIAIEIRVAAQNGASPLIVRADAEKLAQVLLNLLSNSVKFTPPGGRVTIEFVPNPSEDGIALLQVRDNGVGIPADKLQTIFEPFVQLGRGLTRNAEGTGLGLSISRDLMRSMGGDLVAESVLGAGSTFTIQLVRA